MSRRIKVLIADDVAETRKSIMTLLDLETRIEVVGEASNGKEALEVIKKVKPNVVLMDINMPIMDGLEATQKIKEQFSNIIVIIMSVQGEREYLRRAMHCGAEKYLIKPFSLDTLIDAIIEIYEKGTESEED